MNCSMPVGLSVWFSFVVQDSELIVASLGNDLGFLFSRIPESKNVKVELKRQKQWTAVSALLGY